jgi:hypothetical protein
MELTSGDYAAFTQEGHAVASGKRELIEPTPGDKRYVTRDAQGRFKTVVDVGKSLARDIQQPARRTSKPGYGHQGDQRKRPKK